jgi:putative transposase
LARPLRIEFEHARYHVTSRGDRREPIFLDDTDRMALLALLEQACVRFDASVLAYCVMGNHHHLVLATRRANLSMLMRHLNGVYTQRFNRRHGKAGHVFQGRFKAILVDADAYMLSVCRYVDLNPVRARMVTAPDAWPWSSYRAHVRQAEAPPWLDTAPLAAALLGREPDDPASWREASARYAAGVAEHVDAPLWPADCASRSTWATRCSSAACGNGPHRTASSTPKYRSLSAPAPSPWHIGSPWARRPGPDCFGHIGGAG